MEKEDFNKLENPPEGWHRTNEIKPCSVKVDGKDCGKITEFMYPLYGKFVCEDHRGGLLGMFLCCTNCFEPYWPSFPERAEQFGDKWTGHCNGGDGCCHSRDRQLKEDRWLKEGDGALKAIELSVSAEGNPMIVINTERNHYTIYWRQDHELFRAYADKGGKFLNHFKLQREICNHGQSEAIDLVSFFNGTRDVTKHRPFGDDYIGHELEIPPHVEGNGKCPC